MACLCNSGLLFCRCPGSGCVADPRRQGPRQRGGDDAVLEWIRAQVEKVQYITSVCTGAMLLQRTGILTNKRATTHWQLLDAL